MSRRAVALLLSPLVVGAVLAAAARAAEPPVAYGTAVTRGDQTKNLPPEVISRPDPAQVLDGRYGDKVTHEPVVVISHDKGRIFARMQGLPALEVVFDRRPPPRATLVLVFTPDASGRLVLAGFISGDVGGELVPAP